MGPATVPTLRADQTFRLADAQEFGRLSGDRNPLHVDELAARRLVAGAVVVHGANLVLVAAEMVSTRQHGAIIDIHCEFTNPICVDDLVSFSVAELPDELKVSVTVRGLACASIRFSRRERTPAPPAAPAITPGHIPLEPSRGTPDERPIEALLDHPRRVPLASADLEALFPGACRMLGPVTVRAIATISYVVGMCCPGMHSMSSSYRFAPVAGADANDGLTFVATKFDPRFQLAVLRLAGPIVGDVKAFVRPAPTTQPTFAALRAYVRPDEFAGRHVLVVGGSRGMGEVAAKLLAAGGAAVTVTWAAGQADAERVAADIVSGGGECRVLPFRAGHDAPDALLQACGPVDGAWFFATPNIFRKGAPVFDPARFHEFCDTYLTAFTELCRAFDAARRPGKSFVCFPSSTAIDERPKGLVEYAMAKAAAELLGAELNRTLGHVTVRWHRFPRTATDQTATVFEVATPPVHDLLLPVLRDTLA